MNITRVTMSDQGILYMDENYKFYVFEFKDDQLLPLKEGLPIYEYCLNGFGHVLGDTIKARITPIITDDSDYDYLYHGYEDAFIGMPFDLTRAFWMDHLFFHSVLVLTRWKFLMLMETVKNTVFSVEKEVYNDICSYISEDEFIPLTDVEIDKLKSGDLPEDWYNNIKPGNKVLCRTNPHHDHDINVIIGYNAKKNVCYRELDKMECEEDTWYPYAIPITDKELDSFKVGL